MLGDVRSTLTAWFVDFKGDLLANTGWKLILKGIGGVLLIAGFLNGYQLFLHQKNSMLVKSSKDEYDSIRDALDSHSVTKRIDAINSLAYKANELIPPIDPPSLFDTFLYMIGVKDELYEPRHRNNVINALRLHYQSLSKDGSNEKYNTLEVETIIKTLGIIGRDIASKEKKNTPSKKISSPYTDECLIESGIGPLDGILKSRNLSNDLFWLKTYDGVEDLNNFFISGKLNEVSLEKYDLAEGIYNETDFSRATLTYSSFVYSELLSTIFNEADLTSVDFRAVKGDGIFSGARIYNSKFSTSKTNLAKSNFSSTRIFKSNFIRARMETTKFNHSDITQSLFNCSSMQNSSFKAFECRECDFSYSDLRYSDFSDSNIKKSKFVGASLVNVEFTKSILEDVDFSNSDLSYTDFSDTTFLAGVKFFPIKAKGMNIYGVKGLSEEQRENLLSLGAIELCPTSWDKFREDGRPLRWENYRC